MLKSLVTVVATALVTGSAFAAAPRSPIVVTGSYTSEPFYVHCINELATVTVNYESHFQYFETGSGNVHILDNWSYTALYTSASGRQWFGKGVSPWSMNIRPNKGQVYEYVSFSKMNSLDGGSSFIYKYIFRFIVNANGEVVVDKPYPGDADAYKCLGPKD